jgi:hypothetical protein
MKLKSKNMKNKRLLSLSILMLVALVVSGCTPKTTTVDESSDDGLVNYAGEELPAGEKSQSLEEVANELDESLDKIDLEEDFGEFQEDELGL